MTWYKFFLFIYKLQLFIIFIKIFLKIIGIYKKKNFSTNLFRPNLYKSIFKV